MGRVAGFPNVRRDTDSRVGFTLGLVTASDM